MSKSDRPTYWIGTDEAGYGSRLGPLVISASAWKIAAAVAHPWKFSDPDVLGSADQLDWHQMFLCSSSQVSRRQSSPAMQVLDSKKLYSAGKSLHGLQRVVSSLLQATGTSAKTTQRYSDLSTATTLKGTCFEPTSNPYWLTSQSETSFDLPPDWPETISADAESWLNRAIEPVGCRSLQIHESEFNDGLISAGNKATLLSRTTLQLVRFWLDHLSTPANMIVDLDRHGGRKKYLPLLLEATEADWIEVLWETPEESTYRWNTEEKTIYFRFCVGGERRFPVAMASIFSKLLRERAMECFNRFWCQKQPDLTPTAGYPVDAERFKIDSHQLRSTLKVSDHQFWRNA